MILFFSIKILKKKEPLNLASNCKEEKDREFSIQQGVLDTVFTYRSRGLDFLGFHVHFRVPLFRHSVKEIHTRRSFRSRLNRSRTHTARRSFLEWQICLAFRSFSLLYVAREPRGEETSTEPYVALVPSLLLERLSYASPESGATTPRSPPTF